MNHVLRAWASHHTLNFNADHTPGRIFRGDCLCHQTIDFLGGTARNRCPSLEWVGSMDMYFGLECFLSLNNGLSNVFGKHLDFWPGVCIDALHDFVECIAETRHVYTCLGRIKVGIQVKRGVEPLLVSLVADQDGLGHTDHACTSQSDMDGWLAALNIPIK